MNSTLTPDHNPWSGNLTQSLPAGSQRILIVLYTITTLLAVFGNLLVIIVFVVGRRARTGLRSFLANLALADLSMALFCMPFTFTYTMLHEWVFGAAMCTLVLFMQTVSVTASVGTSTAIAIDRYLVVAHPLSARSRKCRARFVIAAIWLIASCLCSVQLVVGRMQSMPTEVPGIEVTHCLEAWPEPSRTWKTGYTYVIFLQTYVVPLCLIGFTYGLIGRKLWRRRAPGNADQTRDFNQLKSKQKVIKMLVIVVVLFAVCWLPLHVFTLFMDYNPDMDNESQAEASSTGTAVFTTVHWLAMSNSFVNSIVYGFLNDSFRSDLRWLFGKYLCCTQLCGHCLEEAYKSDTMLHSEVNTCRNHSLAYTSVGQLEAGRAGRHVVRLESLQPPSTAPSRRPSSLLAYDQSNPDNVSMSSTLPSNDLLCNCDVTQQRHDVTSQPLSPTSQDVKQRHDVTGQPMSPTSQKQNYDVTSQSLSPTSENIKQRHDVKSQPLNPTSNDVIELSRHATPLNGQEKVRCATGDSSNVSSKINCIIETSLCNDR